MKLCAVVPSHNHWKALAGVVERLRHAGLPVFIVDDGSSEPAASAIAKMQDEAGGVAVYRLPVNSGKGAAVSEGFRLAATAGFTHALQVDADGQHDLDALPQMIALAEAHPDALITGRPQYDDSIPTGRKLGRWITHFWVWVETLSLEISDSMCGFRVYPLSAARAVLAAHRVGRRMDFDTDIMVRMFWAGTRVMALPVKVVYPADNTSNFDLWRDNLRITWMHTRLVVRMLVRWLPVVVRRLASSPRAPRHWSRLAERGAYWGLRFCALACRSLGRRGSMTVIAPIVAWFFLTGSEQRRASRAYLGRVLGRPATVAESFRHFLSFAQRAVDTFSAWTGAISSDAVTIVDRDVLASMIADTHGAVIIVAHFGSVDVARALFDEKMLSRLVVLVHTRHAANYNRVLSEFRPNAARNLFQVSEIGPETAIALKDHVERGNWVCIAADRTPIGGGGRVAAVPFLGTPARFPQGPWILAALLGCPVYLLSCLKQGETWRLNLERFAERIELPRGNREQALQGYAAAYAGRLETYVRQAPFQWYNFYDFWAH